MEEKLLSIETASSWTLPKDSRYKREPARPVHLRPANFAEEFDWLTVLYDCVRSAPGKVMLIAPPLDKFNGVLDSLILRALPSGRECSYQVHHKFRLCRLLAEVSDCETSLHAQCAVGETVLAIRPAAHHGFAGRRVLFTLSRNNDPAWICDWMRFYRDVHGADAVLLYDNGSTVYTPEALLSSMRQVSGFAKVVVVSWPSQYGHARGVNGQYWDSFFCQDGAMDDARWRFLAQASAVLNTDVDELAICANGNLFDKAAQSRNGYVTFPGVWVDSLPHDHELSSQGALSAVRHRDNFYRLAPKWRWKRMFFRNVNLCPTKWAIVPERCPEHSQWSVHKVLGAHPLALAFHETAYRHFRQISTNWKYVRGPIDPVRSATYQVDTQLQEAFAKVDWKI